MDVIIHQDDIAKIPEQYRKDFCFYAVEYAFFEKEPVIEDELLRGLWLFLKDRIDWDFATFSERQSERGKKGGAPKENQNAQKGKTCRKCAHRKTCTEASAETNAEKCEHFEYANTYKETESTAPEATENEEFTTSQNNIELGSSVEIHQNNDFFPPSQNNPIDIDMGIDKVKVSVKVNPTDEVDLESEDISPQKLESIPQSDTDTDSLSTQIQKKESSFGITLNAKTRQKLVRRLKDSGVSPDYLSYVMNLVKDKYSSSPQKDIERLFINAVLHWDDVLNDYLSGNTTQKSGSHNPLLQKTFLADLCPVCGKAKIYFNPNINGYICDGCFTELSKGA